MLQDTLDLSSILIASMLDQLHIQVTRYCSNKILRKHIKKNEKNIKQRE